MKEYFQKIIISVIQNSTDWFRIAFLLVSVGLFVRISIILMLFSSFYGSFGYCLLAILIGILFDLSVVYIFCWPFVAYRICVTNKFFITKVGQAIYNMLFFTVTSIIISIFTLDLLIFKATKNRLSEYLADFNYYKKIWQDFNFEEYYVVLLAVVIIIFCVFLYAIKFFKKIKFKHDPSFTIKALIASIFLLICHILFIQIIEININLNITNRYVKMLPNNIIYDIWLPIFHKKTIINIEQLDKNFARENKNFIYSEKEKKNVILFLIDGLSIDDTFHLKNISNKGIYFSNAISCNKKYEIEKILYADPIQNKCDVMQEISKKYNTVFFNNFAPQKDIFFNEIFSRCGFKKHKNNPDIYQDMLDNAKQNFVFVSIVKYKSKITDDEIFNFMITAMKKEWFKDTVFIFAGINSTLNGGKIANFEEYKVPIIFYGQSIDKAIVDNIASTIDIIPTIADITSVNHHTMSLGRSMLNGTDKRAFIVENGTYSSITKYRQNIN